MPVTNSEKALLEAVVNELRQAKKKHELAAKRSVELQLKAKEAIAEEAKAQNELQAIRQRLSKLSETEPV